MADGEAEPGAGGGGIDASGEAPGADSDIEARARRYGWVPETEFKGKKESWADAQAWVTRTETELPIALNTVRRLETTLTTSQREKDEATRRLAEMSGNIEEMKSTLGEFREFARKGNETAYARAKREYEEKLDAQVGAADVAGARETRRALAELEETKPKPEPVKVETRPAEKQPDPPPRAATPAIRPETVEWIQSNKAWFEDPERPELNALAVAHHAKLLRERPDLPLTQNLAQVKAEVIRRYPEHFSNPRREQPGAVAEPNGTGGTPRGNGRSFADLPQDAKNAFAKFKRQMPDYTEKEYLANYDWDA